MTEYPTIGQHVFDFLLPDDEMPLGVIGQRKLRFSLHVGQRANQMVIGFLGFIGNGLRGNFTTTHRCSRGCIEKPGQQTPSAKRGILGDAFDDLGLHCVAAG